MLRVYGGMNLGSDACVMMRSVSRRVLRGTTEVGTLRISEIGVYEPGNWQNFLEGASGRRGLKNRGELRPRPRGAEEHFFPDGFKAL